MKKKKDANKKTNRGFGYHIKHKSKLTSLLLVKILLLFLCFGLGIIFYSSINSFLGWLISAGISLAIACLLYLFLIIKILDLFKF